jgi:hypothetical protein
MEHFFGAEKFQSEAEIELPLVEEVSNDEYKIKQIGCKKLSFPDKLILNGHFFELWDTSDPLMN